MTGPPAPPQQAAMVRTLTVAIAVMTLAIVFLFGAIIGRLLSPAGEGPPDGTIDFAAAPVVEIGVPPGARIVETYVSADRATFVYETVHGEKGVYTTPLTGFDEPVSLVFHSLE